jgi:hypothetical protein
LPPLHHQSQATKTYLPSSVGVGASMCQCIWHFAAMQQIFIYNKTGASIFVLKIALDVHEQKNQIDF